MSRLDRPSKNKPTQTGDPESYRQRIDRISAIFADIAGRAEAVSKFRCPYRDRLDRCTSKFSCRNQQSVEGKDLSVCTHDGKFDYRSAWETRPESYDRIKARIKENKDRSLAKRKTSKITSKKR